VEALRQVKPSMPVPDDFWSFWEAKLRAVRESHDPATVTEVDSPDPSVVTFDVQVPVPGTKGLSGYLAMPKHAKERSLPAVLFPHSAGVRGSQLEQAVKGARLGCIAIDFNAHGLPNGKSASFYQALEKGELAHYASIGASSRDTSYFLGMYLRLIRALDYITNRPEWDGKHLIVYGSSQGGGQALVAAGLDDRISLCLANVPAMCDQTAAVARRTAGWPRMVEWSKMPPDVARYFDAMNFATRIKCPVTMTVGFIDQTCSPTSVYAAYNNITSKKEIINRPTMGHAFPKELIAEFDRRVKEHVTDKSAATQPRADAATSDRCPECGGVLATKP
jgi:cephalosporin-C deacetylase-like acetyl esterase